MWRLAGVHYSIYKERLGLRLRSSFGTGSAEVGTGELKGVQHSAGLFGVELAGSESGEHHPEGLLDAAGAVQGVEDVGAEAWAGRDGARAGAAESLVLVAKGAGDERGRLAAAAVGLGVPTEGIFGVRRGHGGPAFGLNAKSRMIRPEWGGLRPFLISLLPVYQVG